jgi:hypothetical protein
MAMSSASCVRERNHVPAMRSSGLRVYGLRPLPWHRRRREHAAPVMLVKLVERPTDLPARSMQLIHRN